MQTLTFKIPAKPISINNAYGTNAQGGRYLTGEGKSYKHSCYDAAYYAGKNLKELFKFPVNVQLDFYIDNRLINDTDNFVKLTLDGLTGGKDENGHKVKRWLWHDDRDLKRVVAEKHYSPDEQYVIVTIEQMEIADCDCLKDYKPKKTKAL